MIRGSRWGISLLLLGLVACSTQSAPPPMAAAPPAPTSQLAPADAAFATVAAQSDQFAIEISQIAAQKAGRQGIKDFAQSVVDTHTDSANRLAKIAQSKGQALPHSLTDAQAKTVETLNAMPDGSQFRTNYFSSLVQSLLASQRQMEAYTKNGADPELKSFAADQIPVIQGQIATARQLPRQRG